MKLKTTGIAVLLHLLLTQCCQAQSQQSVAAIDSTLYLQDTVLNNVKINGTLFTLELFKRKNADEDNNGKAQALRIKNNETNTIAYSAIFDENEYAIENIEGSIFVEMIDYGGGSGSSGTCYKIIYETGKLTLLPAYRLNELSLVYFKSANEIIVLQGTWNFKEEEAHFAPHRYSITKYTYSRQAFRPTNFGNTRFKYDGFDETTSPKKLLMKIKKKEPGLLKNLLLK